MKYFSYKEFDSPDMPGSGNLMDENFLQMLDEVRDKFGNIFTTRNRVSKNRSCQNFYSCRFRF